MLVLIWIKNGFAAPTDGPTFTLFAEPLLRRHRLEFRFSEIMLDSFLKSEVFSAPSRAHHEGRIAIVTDVERGMRWTCRVAARIRARTNDPMRT